MLRFPLCDPVARRILTDIGINQAVADSLGSCDVRLRRKAKSNRMTGNAEFYDLLIAIIMLCFFLHDAASIK